MKLFAIRRCALPPRSQLPALLHPVDYIESFAGTVPPTGRSMVSIHAALFDRPPAIFKLLLVLRSLLVRPFGIRGVGLTDLRPSIDVSKSYLPGDRLGRWTLFVLTQDEIITGADDRHLDFRVSVVREQLAGAERIVLTTSVRTHNRFGRLYLATILPFHRLALRFVLARGIQGEVASN